MFSLCAPTPTRFDVSFSLFGVPVRISPGFWLLTFLLGMGLTGNNPTHIVMWITAVFLSILIHELGHVWAYHFYGMRGHIVLYHFGGLAIRSGDESYFSAYEPSFRYSRGTKPMQQFVISGAGPFAQLMLTVVLMAAVRLSGHHLTYPGGGDYYFPFLPPEVSVGMGSGPLANQALNDMLFFIVYPSFFWVLLNLVPVFPLDGGQMVRQLFIMYGGPNGVRNSLFLSVIAGIGAAIFGFTSGQLFLAMMFGSLAYASYQLLTSPYGGGYGGGRW